MHACYTGSHVASTIPIPTVKPLRPIASSARPAVDEMIRTTYPPRTTLCWLGWFRSLLGRNAEISILDKPTAWSSKYALPFSGRHRVAGDIFKTRVQGLLGSITRGPRQTVLYFTDLVKSPRVHHEAALPDPLLICQILHFVIFLHLKTLENY